MIMESHSYSYEDDISEEQDLTFKSFERTLEENDINLTPRLMNTMGLKAKSGKYTNLHIYYLINLRLLSKLQNTILK